MAEFSKLVITQKGQALIAKVLAGQGDIEFSKISASSMIYEVEQLDALEELSDVKQINKISKITRTNDVAVKVETAFSNTELTEGYYMRTLGLYAIDPDEEEILYAATTETTGNCYMPAYNGVTVSGMYVQLVTTVGNAENVSIKIDQAAIATIRNIQDLQAQIDMILGKSPDGSGLQFAEGLDAKNVVDAINKVFTSGSEKKEKLVENLTAMGVPASTNETLGQLIDKVLEMTNTSGDTVTAPVLLEGYTAHDATGESITGEMPELADVTVEAISTTQDDNYTYLGLPAGHYSEDSKVRTKNSNLYNLNKFSVLSFTKSFVSEDTGSKYTMSTDNPPKLNVYCKANVGGSGLNEIVADAVAIGAKKVHVDYWKGNFAIINVTVNGVTMISGGYLGGSGGGEVYTIPSGTNVVLIKIRIYNNEPHYYGTNGEVTGIWVE